MTDFRYAITESDTGSFVVRQWVQGNRWFSRGFWQPIGVKDTEQEAVDCIKRIATGLPRATKPPRYFNWHGEELFPTW